MRDGRGFGATAERPFGIVRESLCDTLQLELFSCGYYQLSEMLILMVVVVEG